MSVIEHRKVERRHDFLRHTGLCEGAHIDHENVRALSAEDRNERDKIHRTTY
jgi:hypothetical protein